ncbi:MAG: biopolymer transporter ExbD [Planctomycetota bacterium]
MKRVRKEEPVGMQMTSFVDVLFILLTFFIMVSQVKSSTVHVKLPEVQGNKSEAPSPKSSRIVTITLDQGSKLYLGNDVIDLENLKRQLSEIWSTDGKNTSINIRADDISKSGMFVNILNCVQEVGFQQIEISTMNQTK